jgi:Na+-transporting NADH:ubiquinone oxidoreductase subunit B
VIRGLWDRETVALMLIAAVLPMAVSWLLTTGLGGAGRLVFFLLVMGIWHLLWMLARAQPPSFAGAVTALAVAVLAPEGLGPVPLLIGTSFGAVAGELAFGGWGRNMLNPATVTLAFLGFGFPAAPWPHLAVQVGWAAIPAALIGLGLGVMSGRVLLGTTMVLAAAAYSGVDLSDHWTAILAVSVLLVCDPVASAATQAGRWLYGAFFAAMVVLFAQGWEGAAPVQIAVSAALLASLAAPLLDEMAISVWLYRRRNRLG